MTIFNVVLIVVTLAAVLYAVYAVFDAIITDALNVKVFKEQLRSLGVNLVSGALLGVAAIVIAYHVDNLATDVAYSLLCFTVLLAVVGVIALLEGTRK